MWNSKKMIKYLNQHTTTNIADKKTISFNQNLAYIPPKNRAIILSVDHLTKIYNLHNIKKRSIVLNELNLNIYDQDCIALVGKNGAGKTTLIEILAGVQSATMGDIHFNFPYHYSPYEKLGIQFQTSTYPVGLSVENIINFLIEIRNFNFINPIEKEKMLDIFDLRKILKVEANSLSGGQKQRLNIFLAMVSEPRLIFLDELTTGLDVFTQKRILRFIKDYVKSHKCTLICISHNIFEIEELASRIIFLENGKIKIDADANKVREKYHDISSFIAQHL